MSATLNDMTPEALRDLASRASATANQKEQEAKRLAFEAMQAKIEAEKEKARKLAEKDIIPPPGTFWRYNKRVWTVVGFPKKYLNCLVSVDENGNDVRYWFMGAGESRFSTHKSISYGVDRERWNAGGYPVSALNNEEFKENRTFWEGIGRLVVTVRDIK